MDATTIAVIDKLLAILLAGIGGLKKLGVNYAEVIAAQEQAEAEFSAGNRESPELTAQERQVFIDQAQSAIDRL